MAEKRFKGVIQIEGKLGSSVKDSFGVLSSITQKLTKDLDRLQTSSKNIERMLGKGLGAGIASERFDLLNRRLERTAKVLNSVRLAQRGLSTMGAGLGRLGFGNGYLAVAATAGAGSVFKRMLDAQAEQEQAMIALSVMERSKSKGKQDLTWIDQFAYTTPYQIPEVRDAFVRLKSRGLDPTKDDLLKTIGDAASASGRTMADAVQAFDDAMVNRNQMIAGFGIKVIEQGVGQGKALVEFTNHTGKLMKVLIDKNDMEMKKNLFLAIWKDRYGGLMKEQMSSWTGMLSNLKDYGVRFGLAIMQSGPFEKLKVQLQGLLDSLAQAVKDGSFQKAAEEWGQHISDLIGIILNLGKVLDWLVNHLGGVKFIFYGLSAIIGSSLIVKFGSLARGVWELISGLGSLLRGAWVLLPALGAISAPVWIVIGAVTALAAGAYLIWKNWKPISEWFVNAIHKITDAFHELLEVARELWNHPGDLFAMPSVAGAGMGGLNFAQPMPGPLMGVPSLIGGGGRASALSNISIPNGMGSTTTYNQQSTFNIHTQPGQDPNAIADMVLQKVQGDQAATQAGALYDP